MNYLREKSAKPSPLPKHKISPPFSLEIFRKTAETSENNFKSYTNKLYKKIKIGAFATDKIIKKYIKCSNEKCLYRIYLSNELQPGLPIKCPALHQTCSTVIFFFSQHILKIHQCFMANHAPFTCSLVSTVSEASISIVESSLRMMANFKKCIQCGQLIENLLCSHHVTCKCGKQFCWYCLSDWT